MINTGGVVGSGIGGGVGVITTGPAPCGGIVVGDVTKTPVPCGDIYECGIVPSGGQVITQPCGPGVIGKTVVELVALEEDSLAELPFHAQQEAMP